MRIDLVTDFEVSPHPLAEIGAREPVVVERDDHAHATPPSDVQIVQGVVHQMVDVQYVGTDLVQYLGEDAVHRRVDVRVLECPVYVIVHDLDGREAQIRAAAPRELRPGVVYLRKENEDLVALHQFPGEVKAIQLGSGASAFFGGGGPGGSAEKLIHASEHRQHKSRAVAPGRTSALWQP